VESDVRIKKLDNTVAYYAACNLTLHGKVDSIEEATLSQGVHYGKKEEDEKTIHG
jgi:hypothetical protein